MVSSVSISRVIFTSTAATSDLGTKKDRLGLLCCCLPDHGHQRISPLTAQAAGGVAFVTLQKQHMPSIDT